MSGELATRSVVGFRLEAPNRPWANSTFCTLGMRSKRWRIGSFQIEGASSASGSCGCSSKPWRSIIANAKIASMQKLKRTFPSRTASISRSASEASPQSASADRTGRGARRCVVESTTTALALEKRTLGRYVKAKTLVSQGQPSSHIYCQ